MVHPSKASGQYSLLVFDKSKEGKLMSKKMCQKYFYI